MVASVNRRLLTLAGLVLVSVVAMSMGAATLTSATGDMERAVDVGPEPDVQSNGTLDAGERENASQLDLGEEGENNNQVISLSGCNDLLSSLPGTALYFGALLGVLYVLKRRLSLGALIFGGYAIVPVALAVYFLRTDCITTGGGGQTDSGGGGLGSALQEAPAGPDIPPSIMIGAFALLFVGVAAAIFFSSGEQDYVSDEEEETLGADPDVEDIAAAAANAAERLEARDADVDNEVYRAWWEMTQLLEVSSPETYTPGQFAERAVEVGIDEEYVDPLTTLFEEVRYGHRDASAREERAIDVFRAIEEEYGADSAAETGGDDRTEDDA